MSEAQEIDRERLLSRYPMAQLIQYFLDSKEDSLEIECPEPGTVVDGKRFLDDPSNDPEKVFSHAYQMLRSGGWLKEDVWIAKNGRSIWLFKSEELRLAKKEEWKNRGDTI